jgi:hypothetical protein
MASFCTIRLKGNCSSQLILATPRIIISFQKFTRANFSAGIYRLPPSYLTIDLTNSPLRGNHAEEGRRGTEIMRFHSMRVCKQKKQDLPLSKSCFT